MILELIGIYVLNEVVKSVNNIGKSLCNFTNYYDGDYDEIDFLEENFDTENDYIEYDYEF